jgi:Flp pilus assembly protein TadG
MMMKIRDIKRKSNEHGAYLAEVAIVLPLMLIVMAAIAEFGSYFYTYTTLSKATRGGARYISAKVYTSTERTKAKNIVVCGNLNGCSAGQEILSGLTASNVEITSTGSPILPTTVTVRIVNYRYQSLFDLSKWAGGAIWDDVSVSPSTTMRYMLNN